MIILMIALAPISLVAPARGGGGGGGGGGRGGGGGGGGGLNQQKAKIGAGGFGVKKIGRAHQKKQKTL